MVFSLRIVNADFYTAPPLSGLDPIYSDFRSSKTVKVPVIRIFGSTPNGQKTCLHIHGVFPYICVPYNGDEPTDKYLKQFATSVDFAVHVSQGKASSSTRHVHDIQIVTARSFYGYHVDEQRFMKVSFYNPFLVPRVVELLQNGAVMNKAYQPYESHIPYIQQFFIDYNLYGMNLLNASSFLFRMPLQLIRGNAANITPDMQDMQHCPTIPVLSSNTGCSQTHGFWTDDTVSRHCLHDVERLSVCELEVDVKAEHILNQFEIDTSIGTNPGLLAIWEDERQRREDESDVTALSPPISQDRGDIPLLQAEKRYKERLRQIVAERDLLIRGQQQRQFSQNQPVLRAEELSPSVVDFDSPIVDQSIIQEVVESSQLSFSQQLVNKTDMEMAEILASLAGDSSQSPISSQSVLANPELPDHDDQCEVEEASKEEDEESILMSQQVWDDTDPEIPCSDKDADSRVTQDSQCRFSQFDFEGLDESWQVSLLSEDQIPQLDGTNDDLEDSTCGTNASSTMAKNKKTLIKSEQYSTKGQKHSHNSKSKQSEHCDSHCREGEEKNNVKSKPNRRLGMSSMRLTKRLKTSDTNVDIAGGKTVEKRFNKTFLSTRKTLIKHKLAAESDSDFKLHLSDSSYSGEDEESQSLQSSSSSVAKSLDNMQSASVTDDNLTPEITHVSDCKIPQVRVVEKQKDSRTATKERKPYTDIKSSSISHCIKAKVAINQEDKSTVRSKDVGKSYKDIKTKVFAEYSNNKKTSKIKNPMKGSVSKSVKLSSIKQKCTIEPLDAKPTMQDHRRQIDVKPCDIISKASLALKTSSNLCPALPPRHSIEINTPKGIKYGNRTSGKNDKPVIDEQSNTVTKGEDSKHTIPQGNHIPSQHSTSTNLPPQLQAHPIKDMKVVFNDVANCKVNRHMFTAALDRWKSLESNAPKLQIVRSPDISCLSSSRKTSDLTSSRLTSCKRSTKSKIPRKSSKRIRYGVLDVTVNTSPPPKSASTPSRHVSTKHSVKRNILTKRTSSGTEIDQLLDNLSSCFAKENVSSSDKTSSEKLNNEQTGQKTSPISRTEKKDSTQADNGHACSGKSNIYSCPGDASNEVNPSGTLKDIVPPVHLTINQKPKNKRLNTDMSSVTSKRSRLSLKRRSKSCRVVDFDLSNLREDHSQEQLGDGGTPLLSPCIDSPSILDEVTITDCKSPCSAAAQRVLSTPAEQDRLVYCDEVLQNSYSMLTAGRIGSKDEEVTFVLCSPDENNEAPSRHDMHTKVAGDNVTSMSRESMKKVETNNDVKECDDVTRLVKPCKATRLRETNHSSTDDSQEHFKHETDLHSTDMDSNCNLFNSALFNMSYMSPERHDDTAISPPLPCTPSDIPSDIPRDIPSDIPRDIPRDIPSDIPRDIPSDISSDKYQGILTHREDSIPSSDAVEQCQASTAIEHTAIPVVLPKYETNCLEDSSEIFGSLADSDELVVGVSQDKLEVGACTTPLLNTEGQQKNCYSRTSSSEATVNRTCTTVSGQETGTLCESNLKCSLTSGIQKGESTTQSRPEHLGFKIARESLSDFQNDKYNDNANKEYSHHKQCKNTMSSLNTLHQYCMQLERTKMALMGVEDGPIVDIEKLSSGSTVLSNDSVKEEIIRDDGTLDDLPSSNSVNQSEMHSKELSQEEKPPSEIEELHTVQPVKHLRCQQSFVIMPERKAPSSAELAKHGIPKIRYQTPFYGDPNDVPENTMDVGGRLLKVQSKEVKNLLGFDTRSPFVGLHDWRQLLGANHDTSFLKACQQNIGTTESFLTGIENNYPLRMLFMGDKCLTITPSRVPPKPSTVRTWAVEKLEKKMKSQTDNKKVNKDMNLGEDQSNAKEGLAQKETVQEENNKDNNLNMVVEVNSNRKQEACNGQQSRDGVLCSEPRDGVLCSEPRDGVLCSEPRDGVLCSEPRDGVLCSEPRDGVLCSEPRVSYKQTEITSPDSLFSPAVEKSFTFEAVLQSKRAAVDDKEDEGQQRKHNNDSVHLTRTANVLNVPFQSTPIAKAKVQASTPTSNRNLPQLPLLTPIATSTRSIPGETSIDSCYRGSQKTDSRRQLIPSQFKLGTPDAPPLRRRLTEAGSDIEGPSPINTAGYKVPQLNIQDAKASHEVQHLTLTSIELHVRTRKDRRPDPELDPICALFYHTQTDSPCSGDNNKITGIICVDKDSAKLSNGSQSWCQSAEISADTLKHGITALGPSPGPNGHSKRPLLVRSGVTQYHVKYVEEEKELFQALLCLIRKWDPDILIGYEIQMLSWGFLIQRALVFDLDLGKLLSRVTGSSSESNIDAAKDTWGAAHTSELKIGGRIILNVWRLMRHEAALNIYTFENVAFHILHERIPLYTFRSLSDWWDHKTDLHRWRTVQHYVTRCHDNVRLLEHVDFIGRTSELARLFGILFYCVISRGSQFRVESMMLRMLRPMKYVALSPSAQQRNRMNAPEVIALVLEPESRLYTSPVLVLDFQSLYPSMIIAYNYCYSTCLGRVACLEDIGEFKFGASTLSVPPSLLKKLEDDIHISPNGVAFVKSNVRRGILPKMLEDILNTRIMVKNSMKKWKNKKAVYRMLDARQLGLKLIANVTYGYTAAHYSGRMPCVEIGDSIVRKARETLEHAIHVVNTTSKWNAKVVYGDTDSMFVLLDGVSKDEAFRIGTEIADTVTAMNPKPVKLKFEKVYLPCILQTKKRYVGYMYETADQKEPVFDAKGIETVRRDTCPAVAKVLEKSLRVIFETKDVSLVKRYVQRQFHKVMEGRISLHDLTFAKEYRGMATYKPGACVPALELTRQMLKEDRRSEPRVGERVPYVIVYGSPGLPLIRLVRRPLEVLQNPSLRVNALYYITKQLIPPLNRAFLLMGVDVKTWFAEVPRNARVQSLPSSDTRKKTISHYFTTMSCPVCQQTTTKDLCDKCANDPQKVAVTLNHQIREYERKHRHLSEICYHCCGSRDTKLCCVSLDCPVFHKLVKVTRDLNPSQQLRRILTDYCVEDLV